MTERTCPERPELLDGVPMGQYHCGACLCMVVAGVPHPPHDEGCALPSYSDQDFKALATDYAIAYAVVLNPDQPPPPLLPPGVAWAWVSGPVEPHWAVRLASPS